MNKQVIMTMPLRMLLIISGLFFSMSVLAQQLTVNGHVKDGTGEPVIGATVRVEGQQSGTVTDFDGNFVLNANQGATISISYVGFQTAKVKAAANLIITLQDDSKMLNDVVVIGYGVAKKSDLTGSVTALKPDTKNKGLVVNPQDMLAGKIAGVNVTSNDGAPGSGAQIRIRGGSSLNASNDPLIVIDGVAMDNNGVKGLSNPLSMINPQDIESFNVLKDASATAIYGSRGSNGVIIITTKKGRKGQAPTVSYAGSMTVSTKKGIIEVMDGNEYRSFIEKMWGTNSEAYNALGTENTNWQDLIYRTAVSTDHNLTLAGAAKNLPYRLSVGYTAQNGIIKTSNFERFTGALNLNPSLLNDHLTLNLNAKGMYAKTRYADGEAISAAFAYDPTQSPYWFTSKKDFDQFGGNYESWIQTRRNLGGYTGWIGAANFDDSTWPLSPIQLATKNPLAILNERREIANSHSFIGSADIDYKIHGFEDLRLHLTLGADLSKGRQHRWASPASPQFLYYGSEGAEEISKRNLSLSAYAQYFKDFNKIHHFDVMAGYEWQHFWRSQNSDYAGYYPQTNNDASKRGTALPHTPYNFKTENYLVSFFGRANYTLMERYYLTVTVRQDGSSRFEKHWSTFPSVALAWKLKDESVFKNIKALSDLKLRLGWGMTGQQDLNKNDYAWIPSYSINQGTDSFYPLLDNGVLYRPNDYNRDLKWETTTTYNIGLDWGIIDQRLTGSIDWYYRKTTDLLNYAPMPALASFKNQRWQNIGSLSNTGIEAALDWKVIRAKDFYWTLNYNITYNRNKILDLNGVSIGNKPVANTDIKISTDKYLQYNTVGQAANSFYVFQQVYDKNGKAIEGAVVDRNRDGVITEADRYFYKNAMAPVTMGLSSRIDYKNWDFSFSLRANIGNYVFDNIAAGNSNINKNQVWAPQKFLTNRPKRVLADNWQTYDITSLLSDRFVRNASFLRCDNITLGYNFANLFKTAKYHGVSGRAYATVSNVFTITKYDGLDPEIKNGYDNELYPRPISFIVGVNLNF